MQVVMRFVACPRRQLDPAVRLRRVPPNLGYALEARTVLEAPLGEAGI